MIEILCREFEYRRTLKTGAITKVLVVLDGKIVKPSRVRYSRTGAHGEEYYCLEDNEWNRAWIIKLYQSNSGRRSVITENTPQGVKDLVEQAWIYEDTSIDDIIKALEKLSKIMIKS
jgi:hypothetical protein